MTNDSLPNSPGESHDDNRDESQILPIEPAAADIPDPENELDGYKSTSSVGGQSATPSKVTAVAVRKPSDQEYVQVKSAEERVLPLYKDKANDRLYLFKSEMEAHLDPRPSPRSFGEGRGPRKRQAGHLF